MNMIRAIYMHILAVTLIVTAGGCNADSATQNKMEATTKPSTALNDSTADTLGLGPVVTSYFASTDSVSIQLTVTSREYRGDGRFWLLITDPLAGEQNEYEGRRFTQRGIPSDNDATVWQLRPDYNDTPIYNFLYNSADSTLTLLNTRYEPTDTILIPVD